MALSQWPRLNWVVPSTKASLACLATSAGGAARATGARQRQASRRQERMPRRYPASSAGASGQPGAYYARMKSMTTRILLVIAVAAVTLCLVPSWLSAREAVRVLEGATDRQLALERSLAEMIERSLSTADFPIGSKVIDGEWLFATYMMAGMG